MVTMILADTDQAKSTFFVQKIEEGRTRKFDDDADGTATYVHWIQMMMRIHTAPRWRKQEFSHT